MDRGDKNFRLGVSHDGYATTLQIEISSSLERRCWEANNFYRDLYILGVYFIFCILYMIAHCK